MIPCSLTPFTRKTVTGVLFFRTWFKNTSWTFCDFSLDMGSLPSFLEPERPTRGTLGLKEASFRLRRWARSRDPQALQRVKHACLVRKAQPGYKTREFPGKLLGRLQIAEENRDTAAIASAFHIDRGIADKPYVLPGGHAARCQRQVDRIARGLIKWRVTSSDDATEQVRPAETRDFPPQQVAGLVADHAEIDPLPRQVAQHRFAPWQRRQPFQMDCAESREVNVARFFPALAEIQRERLAQAEAHPLPRLGERPFRPVHRPHQEVERIMNGRPGIDERIVPVEQDGSRRAEPNERLRGNRRNRHAGIAPCTRYAALSWRLNGPGCPSPTGAPSMLITGSTSEVVLVRKASRAIFASSTVKGRSSSRYPSWAIMSSTARRVTPLRIALSAARVTTVASPVTIHAFVEVPSVIRPSPSTCRASKAPASRACCFPSTLGTSAIDLISQ